MHSKNLIQGILKAVGIRILLLIINCIAFIFTPSPNIGVYQLAHYQCSVNHPGVSITWFINRTGSKDNSIIQLGIVTSGGSQQSHLTIPGYPQYNNTVVICFAAGLVNSNFYNDFSESILRIQGNTLSSICYYISSH